MHNYKKKLNEKDHPLNLGAPVTLTEKAVKWHLDNLEIYGMVPNKRAEKDIMMFIYSAMFKQPINGTIVGFGADKHTYRVRYNVKGIGKEEAYFEFKRDFILDELYELINKN